MSRPRLLVVRLGALGDVVLALPALRLLRRSLPEAGIGWLVEERNAAPLLGDPDLNALFVARADRWRRAPLAAATARQLGSLLAALRRERFDLAVDLQGLWKSALWARAAGARRTLGLPRGRERERGSGLLLGARAEAEPASTHVTDLYLATARAAVRALGATPVEPPPGPWLFPSREEAAAAERAIEQAGLGAFAVVNPGAAWPTKRWAPERFGALARALVEKHDLGVFVSFGPGEEDLARRVVASAASPRVRTFATGVRELLAVIARARLLVAGDTGPYHLARAAGTPTLGLFGPTDPGRNGPRGPGERMVWGRVACSPCHGRTCPTAIECMAAIEVDAVLAAAGALLSSPAATSGGGGIPAERRPG